MTRRHDEPVDDEGRELPPLGHRAGRDRERGVHEDHLEEEESERGDVIGDARQEESRAAEEPPHVAADGRPDELVHRLRNGQRGPHRRARPAHLQREPAHPEPQDAERVDHEVHHHRVGRVPGPREAGLGEREARLHEHHEEARDERPDEVERHARLADGRSDLFERGLARDLRGHVRDPARLVAGRVREDRPRHEEQSGQREEKNRLLLRHTVTLRWAALRTARAASRSGRGAARKSFQEAGLGDARGRAAADACLWLQEGRIALSEATLLYGTERPAPRSRAPLSRRPSAPRPPRPRASSAKPTRRSSRSSLSSR